jgi:sulfatase maturation enzyme AslB (radical SAM superfamily)
MTAIEPKVAVPKEALRGSGREKRLVLLVTYACQLDCRYCCVLRSLRGRRDMSIEHMKKSGDFLLTSRHPNLQVHFFGAEPLLLPFENYQAFLPYVRRRAKEEGKNLSMMVTSNAALVRPEWVDLFKEHDVQIEISLDGAPESHNLNRPTVSGRDSYAEIAANLPKLFRAGIGLQVSMVISPQTAPFVVENFNHMVDWGFKRIFMMVANCVTWSPESLAALRENLEPLLEIYPRVMRRKGVRLLNLTDWVWPMRMNTELAVDSSGDIYSACVGYLARDAHLKSRCSLAHIDSVIGTFDDYERLRLKNASAMGIVFNESSAIDSLPSSAMAGQIMTDFVSRLRGKLLAEKEQLWSDLAAGRIGLESGEAGGLRAERLAASTFGSKADRTDPAHVEKVRTEMESIRNIVAQKPTADEVTRFISQLLLRCSYPARVFEVALHSLFQALENRGALSASLRPLAPVRGGKYRQGRVGDIELLAPDGGVLEAWDARFGRTYLRDELEEVDAKLAKHPETKLVGFVMDLDRIRRTTLKTEVLDRKAQIEAKHGVPIEMAAFEQWALVQLKRSKLNPDPLAGGWLMAFAESLSLLRPEQAPLEDAADAWPSEIGAFAREWKKPAAQADPESFRKGPSSPAVPAFLPPA